MRNGQEVHRRGLFRSLAGGVSAAAMLSLLDSESGVARGAVGAEDESGRPRGPVHEPSATSVIHLFMNGGPSQMDLLDPKPELVRRHGQEHLDRKSVV